MKFFISILTLLFIMSCQSDTGELIIPESLEDKKAMLKEKRSELSTLEKEVGKLEIAITEQDSSIEKVAILVNAQEIARSDFFRYVTIQGNVTAEDLFDASAEIGGRIISLKVKEGDAVRAGQLIAEIDPEAIQKQKRELEITLNLATTVFEKQQNLWNQNIGSEIQFLEAKNNKERLEQNIELLDLQLAKTKVYAPAAGIVEHLILQMGELASPGMPIIQILNTDQLKATVAVPENYVAVIDRGETVKVTIPALNLEHNLRVSSIGRTIHPANRTFEVEVNLPRNRQLKPNLLAEMRIVDFMAENVVVVPMNLVQQEVSGAKYVLIVEEKEDGNYAKRQTVEIGEVGDGEAIVTKGLSGGEQIITEGARGLADGELIEVINSL